MKHEQTRALKLRMAQIKSKFPFSSYVPIYEYKFGKLTDEERVRVQRCWNGLTTDEQIITNFEALVEGIKNS